MVIMMRTQVINIAILIFISLFLILITGCQKQVETRGNSPDPKLVSSIKPGIHKRYHVERLLGSPSTIAAFDEELWYYIDSSIKTFSFFKPNFLATYFSTLGSIELYVPTGPDIAQIEISFLADFILLRFLSNSQ